MALSPRQTLSLRAIEQSGHAIGSLSSRREWLGSEGRHGWTKMDMFRFRGNHCGNSGYESKLYGTHEPCPHSGWTWKGHVGSNKIKQSLNKMINPTFQQGLGREGNFLKKYKDQNDRIGKVYQFRGSLDTFSLTNRAKSRNRGKHLLVSLGLN